MRKTCPKAYMLITTMPSDEIFGYRFTRLNNANVHLHCANYFR